jgi:signal transduction histidine kinase
VGVAAILAAMVVVEILAGSAPATWTAGTVGVGVDLLSTIALVVAALAFVARPSRTDRGTELLAGACLLLAAADMQFVTMPVVPAGWVTPREGARVLAFALVLGGAFLRHRHVQRHRVYAAICSERERAARDLHDGLAQDLACITTAAQRLDCDLQPGHPLTLATRDALAEVRGMIADLTASTAATSEEAARMVARDVGRRLELDVDVRAAADRAPARQVDVALGRPAGHAVVRVSSGADRASDGPAGEAKRKWRARSVSRLSAECSRRARRLRPI